MDEDKSHKQTIPANVRVLIALVASPTLMVIGMLIYTILFIGWKNVSISMIIFSTLGLICYYIVFTGKLPRIPKQK
ncbi:hypothetical protein L0668_17725 [Paraglaciecola aquimarina]|uniref:SoxR reducing system RseC family protein n=1 Tax=Paraglaciecola algarum TaxID=3050085 RepID=A0ABS9DAL8_9ALTE|nr:hypothetical protein [Paraglaciecola sp. G1-23]MCF2949964.1 hypothetical protein [Paraglaciecola sp. G1-23]